MTSHPYFTDHHARLRERVRAFAHSVVQPTARQYDAESRFPWDNVKRMADLGLFGVPWPEALGGGGMDYLSYILVIHELAKVDASHAITISAHTTLGTSPIVDFGTAAQQATYVPLLAGGRVLAGFGLTEPGAGSDAGGTRTSAVAHGDHYVLNGSKIFITHAGVGEIFVVTARTEGAAGRTGGITAFIVTKDTCDLVETARLGMGHDAALPKCPGVLAGKKEDKLGWRASDTRELIFQDAIVPKDNLLGTVNAGFRQMLHTLDGGRIGLGALALGIAEGALEQCLEYTATRRQFGKPIATFGHRDRGRDPPGLPCRLAQADGPALQAGGRDGEALRLGARHARHDQGRPAARRPRLYHRLSRRADDAGRQDLRDRGRHERDPADRDRAAAVGRVDRLDGGGRARAVEGGGRKEGPIQLRPRPPSTTLDHQTSGGTYGAGSSVLSSGCDSSLCRCSSSSSWRCCICHSSCHCL